MTTITPAMVPTKAPGTLFDALTTDTTLGIRWLVATDPCFYATLNRPTADIAVRQLILAKAIDSIQLNLGHTILYPFLIQPKVSSGTQQVDTPSGWIWDFHASLPKKWENLRLAKIKRISGENNSTSGYDGYLRLIFTANVFGSTSEVSIFSADYQIDSDLAYQPTRLTVVGSSEESVPIDSGEAETVSGFLIFRTLDTSQQTIQDFIDVLAEPGDTSVDSGGFYSNPTIYEVVDSTVDDGFSTSSLSHGTGLLTDSAWNAIPQLDSDIQSWLVSFNYPFSGSSNLTSTDNITIPQGLFKEFNIVAPASDEPTGSIDGLSYPVWISRIERIGSSSNNLRFYFATYNVTDLESGGSPSTQTVEFATLDLLRSYTQGEIVSIVPASNLQLISGSEHGQHFGRGHVVLSSLWDRTTSHVDDFFNLFSLIPDDPADTLFTKSSTRIGSFGISRVPKFSPTAGQSAALKGSSARRTIPVHPGYNNRYVTESDQGLGNSVNLESQPGITPHAAIDGVGYQGSLTHRVVKLVVDSTAVGNSATFYDDEILPRLTILFGRPPEMGDFWFNGTRLLFMTGDSWVG